MVVRIRFILVLISLIHFVSLSAQNERNNWYFGYGAGLNFSSGTPSLIKGGALRTNEGCATISDSRGKLLFYTDGVTVWNRLDQKMINGNGLAGSYTSTQSAVIVPEPGNKNRYFIFTVGEQVGNNGLSYSVVDMRKSKGYGDVVIKNRPITDQVTEKLAAVGHCNGKDVWIICHKWNSNAFYTYLLTSGGLKKPVISNVGVFHKQVNTNNKGESIGCMRVSPNGKKLALVIAKMDVKNIGLFDFDNANGKVSNPKSFSSGKTGYGVCFSPDNSKLYISYETGNEGIIQYDLNAKNVNSTKFIVAGLKGVRYGAMQVGGDGKIYVATGKSFLDVINKPNLKGKACAFSSKQLSLGKIYSTYGLPEFMVNFNGSMSVDGKLNLGNDTTVCSSKLVLGKGIRAGSYLWSTGETTPTIEVSASGEYWLKVGADGCSAPMSDTIVVKLGNVIDLELGRDTTVYCRSKFDLTTSEGGKYKWSTGETSRTISISKTGKYWLQVTKRGCVVSDTIKVVFRQKPPIFKSSKQFYPNNNGLNDKFDYIIRNVSDFELKIFNKKKKLVFKTNDVKNKWDGTYKGKTVDDGKYFWHVKYKVDCSGEVINKKGEVTVINRDLKRSMKPSDTERFY